MKYRPENPQATKIKHKYEDDVSKLSDMEDVLIDKIVKTEDDDLMNIFLDWQKQRNICNEEYIKWVQAMLAERSKSNE